MVIECVTPELKRFVIISPAINTELAVGDVISWIDNGTMSNPNDTVDVIIRQNGVAYDQGVSTGSGFYTLTEVPAGDFQLCLLEILRDNSNNVIGTGEECCYPYTGAATTETVLKTIDFNVPDTGPMNEADWQALYGSGYSYDPSNPALGEIISGELHFLHPQDVAQTQGAGCNLPLTEKKVYTLTQEMTLPSNFDHGQGPGSGVGGKIGFGFGRRADDNSIVSGGSTNTTGWLLRTAFRDDALTAYSYFGNRTPAFPPFGEDIPFNVNWQGGLTYILGIRATMNDPGQSNGLIELFVNNVLTNTRAGVMFTSNGNEGVDVFTFNSFHGGSGLAFSPGQNMIMQYNNALLTCSDS